MLEAVLGTRACPLAAASNAETNQCLRAAASDCAPTHQADTQAAWQVLEEQLAWRGSAVAPLRPALVRTLADVQHRLTFRAQAFIKVGSGCLGPSTPPAPGPPLPQSTATLTPVIQCSAPRAARPEWRALVHAPHQAARSPVTWHCKCSTPDLPAPVHLASA